MIYSPIESVCGHALLANASPLAAWCFFPPMQEALAGVREENALLYPPRRHVQDCMTRPSERCSATTTYQEGRESGRAIDERQGALSQKTEESIFCSQGVPSTSGVGFFRAGKDVTFQVGRDMTVGLVSIASVSPLSTHSGRHSACESSHIELGS